MVQFIPPPDLRNLLPPLLACLPLSFASPRAPPALLPLLSPILRQRVQLLAANSTSLRDSWLPLLCWQSDLAEKLGSIVESDAFELHPISGDVEFREVDQVIYRRLDSETLHARIVVAELSLVVVYLWCQGDQEGGGDGWRVAEVRPLDSPAEPERWWPTIGQADEHSKEQILAEALRQGDLAQDSRVRKEEDDDDDDYWAQYDQTPGRTPAMKRSPAPQQNSPTDGRARATSDAEYYSQYAQVQPALDNDDPSEEHDAIGESALNGSTLTKDDRISPPTHAIPSNHDRPPNDAELPIDQPRATSPSAASAAVSRWEETAEGQSMAETAIRQHVSTSVKSLYRLARGVGMERGEFERMVRVELDALGMLEE